MTIADIGREVIIVHNKECKILGAYCWTHQTIAGPFEVRSNGDERISLSPWDITTESITWANGDSETPKASYRCVVCANYACAHPVAKNVEYKEIRKGGGYWGWAETHAFRDSETGVLVEPKFANPDALEG